MENSDTQVGPLLEVFELYMLRDATLADMREPTAVAARAMLDSGISPGMILRIIEGAVDVAETAATALGPGPHARELRSQIGPWLMTELFDPGHGRDDGPLAA
jgi:hypothetical protein